MVTFIVLFQHFPIEEEHETNYSEWLESTSKIKFVASEYGLEECQPLHVYYCCTIQTCKHELHSTAVVCATGEEYNSLFKKKKHLINFPNSFSLQKRGCLCFYDLSKSLFLL
jgi:hypothetical protein